MEIEDDNRLWHFSAGIYIYSFGICSSSDHWGQKIVNTKTIGTSQVKTCSGPNKNLWIDLKTCSEPVTKVCSSAPLQIWPSGQLWYCGKKCPCSPKSIFPIGRYDKRDICKTVGRTSWTAELQDDFATLSVMNWSVKVLLFSYYSNKLRKGI